MSTILSLISSGPALVIWRALLLSHLRFTIEM